MYKRRIITVAGASLGLVALMSVAVAQGEKAIYTGGEKGAYHSVFCPPIPNALSSAYFTGYRCTSSGGTVDNFNKVLQNPRSIGFAQYDVLARAAQDRPDDHKKVVVVRRDIACEGLWMVTKNERLSNYGEVLAVGRRVPFVIPGSQDAGRKSGTQVTFEFLQSTDPNGLGQAQNIKYVADATTAINTVANGNSGEVAFFVQFADPSNPNIQLVNEKKLKVIPVRSREIVNAEVAGEKVFEVQEFSLSSGGVFKSGQSHATACTPVALFTGSPDLLKGADQTDQKEMIQKLREMPSDALLPKEDRFARILKATKRLSGQALEELNAATDLARKKYEEIRN